MEITARRTARAPPSPALTPPPRYAIRDTCPGAAERKVAAGRRGAHAGPPLHALPAPSRPRRRRVPAGGPGRAGGAAGAGAAARHRGGGAEGGGGGRAGPAGRGRREAEGEELGGQPGLWRCGRRHGERAAAGGGRRRRSPQPGPRRGPLLQSQMCGTGGCEGPVGGCWGLPPPLLPRPEGNP